MGDPAKKVLWDDERPAPVWDDEPEPGTSTTPAFVTYQPPITDDREGVGRMEQAPAPAAPKPEPVGAGETAVTEFGQGASFELADELKAGVDAFGNWVKAHSADPLDPRTGRVAETSGRGMNAPLKGYDDYLREYAERRARGKAENPVTATTANIAGGMAGGMALPGFKAANGAGMLARAGTGLANVAADTAIGSATAAAAAEPGQRLEAAKAAAPMAAGLSTLLRAPGAIAEGVRGVKQASLAALPDDLRKPADVLTSLTPEGRAARAAAQRGQQALDPTTRAITKTLSEGEELTDAVLDYAKVGLKRAPIAKAMAAEAVDPQKAVMSTGQTLEQLALEIEDMHGKIGEFEAAGKQSIRYAKDAFDGMRDEIAEALGRTGEEGGDAAADLFMKVDQLKRKMGRAVKRAGQGASSDPFVEERLNAAYHTMRDLLEDESVWGKGAAGVQREVNAAWTPWLTQRKAFNESVLAGTARKRGANPFDDLAEADPAKVQSMLENAGRASNDLKERDLRQGLETTQGLVRTLAKNYDAPPEIVGKAAQVAKGAGDVLGTYNKTRGDLVAARELRDVSAAAPSIPMVPKLGSAINTLAAGERMVADSGLGKAAQRVSQATPQMAKDALGALPEAGRKMAAASQGRSSADAQLERSADLALKDPNEPHAQALAQKQGDDRATAYAVLLHTDPEFRARQKQRAKQQQAQQDQQQEQ